MRQQMKREHNRSVLGELKTAPVSPTVEAGVAPMQALLGEPDEGIGSPVGSPEPADRASDVADDG
jgi:hypothetical protein